MKINFEQLKSIILGVGALFMIGFLYRIDQRLAVRDKDNQYYLIGKYYQTKNDEEYNLLKIENDFFQCMENARVLYETLWKEHCHDEGKDGYCFLDETISRSLRNKYEQEKVSCKE